MDTESFKWLFIAFLVGVTLMLKSKRKLSLTSLSELSAVLGKAITTTCSFEDIKENLLSEGYILRLEEPKKLIFESTSIGFFHWGFIYFLIYKEDGLHVGIFPKGLNPPRDKALQKYLDAFCQELQKCR